MSLTTKQIKQYIRQPYAWPGGYEIVFITEDGGILCHECARNNWREICDSVTHDNNDGWKVVDIAVENNTIVLDDEESPVYCDHCNKNWLD